MFKSKTERKVTQKRDKICRANQKAFCTSIFKWKNNESTGVRREF